MRIEHAFGVLKARWPSLYDIPVRIDEQAESGHDKVMKMDDSMPSIAQHARYYAGYESWLQGKVVQSMRANEGNQGGNNRERN